MSIAHRTARRLERMEVLDRLARPAASALRPLLRPRAVRNLLSGTNLGHPLHPMLTDVPIGAWTMATLLDTVGGTAAAPAADLLVAAGIVAAVPTAASGLNDWSDTSGPEARVGLLHAMTNTVTLGLNVASLAARARGSRRRGRVLGLAGFGVMLTSAYLGGHLSYVLGVNINRTAWEQRPGEWIPVLPDSELAEGKPQVAEAGGVPVVLYRSSGEVRALSATCSHMGGPLGEGTISDGCVTCPWHGSTFRLADGAIVRGPASTPQPVFQTRVRDGHIEVRAES
jgi:nitrite reductase/ring-hydroxylating ferredoxin subunit/uncharacterized membrane protein